MKKFILIFSFLLFSLLALAQSIDDLFYGTDNSLEIITWNTQMFPMENDVTIDYVKQFITALDADIIAFQEIYVAVDFIQMIDDIPGYEAYIGDYNDWIKLAFIYKSDVVQVNDAYEIYTHESYDIPFLRDPFVIELSWQGEDYIVINNHLKAMGDGVLDTADAYDEENRRLQAIVLLKAYIEANFPNDKLILLGDLNDVLTDSPENNVFQPFLDEPDNYLFADYTIAVNDNSNWSYPSWPSHIDHILITNEFFDSFHAHSSSVEVLKLEDYLPNGWNTYSSYISDHRPVALKYFPNENYIFNKDFEYGSLISGGWMSYNLLGAQDWNVPTSFFGHNNSYCAYMNGFADGANENWFVSPEFNADEYDDLTLSFWSTSGYNGPDLQLFYSANFVDNPETATWVEINDAFFHNGETAWEWTFSGLIDLSEFEGTNARIAFKYTSTNEQAAAWEIDDILLSNAPNTFNVMADANNSSMGNVSGHGRFICGESVSLNAVADDGYSFVSWTENEIVVSTAANFSFRANSDRNLIANFKLANNLENDDFSVLKMYPNPTEGKLSLQGVHMETVEVFDLQGKNCYAMQVGSTSATIDLSHITAGLYLIKIVSDQAVYERKLIIE